MNNLTPHETTALILGMLLLTIIVILMTVNIIKRTAFSLNLVTTAFFLFLVIVLSSGFFIPAIVFGMLLPACSRTT